MEQALTWALVLLVIIGIGLPLYWLNQPRRETGAFKLFDNKAVQVGMALFQPADSTAKANAKENELHFGCAGCHGNKGQGGSTNYTITTPLGAVQQVSWQVPALDTALLRFTPDTVRTVIVYGRSNTPMPAWGLAGGGPMNDQQIDALVAYLKSIQITPAAALAAAAQYGTDGSKIFNAYCARCHTKGFTIGQADLPGGGAYGPNLTNGGELRQFPNIADQIDYITKGAEYGKATDPRHREHGARHPAGHRDHGRGDAGGRHAHVRPGADADQIKAVIDYERGL